jgi:hypothetical protein
MLQNPHFHSPTVLPWSLPSSMDPRHHPSRALRIGIVLGTEVLAQQPLLGVDPCHQCPCILGMTTSVTRRCIVSRYVFEVSIADGPSAASRTAYPSPRRSSFISFRKLCSSSTRRRVSPDGRGNRSPGRYFIAACIVATLPKATRRTIGYEQNASRIPRPRPF